MRIDLPQCNLKTCRLYSDGNCVSKEHYDKCEYILAKKAIVRHAHWEWRQFPISCGRWEMKTVCSNCYKTNKNYEPPYCPHCGARMDEEVEP